MAKSHRGETFSYAQVEGALAQVLEIHSSAVGAFRARICHLRKLRVPSLPAPGSGSRIRYSALHAIELGVALKLQDVGHNPSLAAVAARTAAANLAEKPKLRGFSGNAFLVIFPAQSWEDQVVVVVEGMKAVEGLLDDLGAVSALSLSILACRIEAALRVLTALDSPER